MRLNKCFCSAMEYALSYDDQSVSHIGSFLDVRGTRLHTKSARLQGLQSAADLRVSVSITRHRSFQYIHGGRLNSSQGEGL
jgi:hypothetical protein